MTAFNHGFFIVRLFFNIPMVLFLYMFPLSPSFLKNPLNPIPQSYPSILPLHLSSPNIVSILSLNSPFRFKIITAILNRSHGDHPAKNLTEIRIVGASNVSLLDIYSNYAVSVGTNVVSNISLDDPTSLQCNLHIHYVSSSKPEGDIFFFRALQIIPEHNILPYP